jgi:endonuclease/exonuclease/phosphatase family metal-dependent hydrolase
MSPGCIALSTFSIVTINILNDLSLWDQRCKLLLDQLVELDADLIAMQEVRLKGESSTAHWLCEKLNQRQKDTGKSVPYQVLLCQRTGVLKNQEGIAVLSRLPIKRNLSLDLLTQNRVAQVIVFRVDGSDLILVNGHFFWQPGVSDGRQRQIELLLDFLDTQPVDQPVVVCGDFNGVPGTPAIERMRQYFDSAYMFVNKHEPEYTCPTPLPQSKRVHIRNLIMWLLRTRPYPYASWQGTLDYIFVDPRLQTLDCKVVLNVPADENPQIYPSDHLGLWAEVKVN